MDHRDETIAAVSTPPGVGGIAVIRISGKKAVGILKKLLKNKENSANSEKRRILHGWIVEKDEPIDEVVATVFRSPNSYTGEDIVEISCHGGNFISHRILELITAYGARLAAPGEFTQRAFLNGKMDLSQAEAVVDLIHAQTEASRRVAAYQLNGRLSEKLIQIRDQLIQVCSRLELKIDFSEEDVNSEPNEKIARFLSASMKKMTSILVTYTRGRVCREGIRMVIIGKPNVGKSSILNALLEKERAIVAASPGTTRDTVEDVLDIEGLQFSITDTAGIRETNDQVEREGVNRAEQALEKADLVLLIVDGSELLTKEDEDLIQKVAETHKSVIGIINKIDKPEKIVTSRLQNRIPGTKWIRISALKRKGISELIQILKKTVLSGDIPQQGEVILTKARHKECISRAIERISFALTSIQKGMSPEFIVIDVREALDALGEITGQTMAEDILNKIFSEFCIGK